MYTTTHYDVILNPEKDTNYDITNREHDVVEQKVACLPQAIEIAESWSGYLDSKFETSIQQVLN